MAGPVFPGLGAIRCWLAASLVLLLTGCTTPPVPHAPRDAAPVLSSSEALPQAATAEATATVAAAAPAPAPPARSRFADFLARRLRKPPETPEVPVPAAAPVEEAMPVAEPEKPVDEKYRLTGEAALELERGHASWYGAQFHGRRTASGEQYDKYALTAAHKTLPFGTIVRVRSLALGREVDVRINDRGPFARGRVIDVSQAAAEALGLMGSGGGEVSLNVAGRRGRRDKAAAPSALSPKTGKAARRPKA
jgi:rare lipoprotein A